MDDKQDIYLSKNSIWTPQVSDTFKSIANRRNQLNMALRPTCTCDGHVAYLGPGTGQLILC